MRKHCFKHGESQILNPIPSFINFLNVATCTDRITTYESHSRSYTSYVVANSVLELGQFIIPAEPLNDEDKMAVPRRYPKRSHSSPSSAFFRPKR